MSDQSANDLIHALADDLEPVRPIPRLRTLLAGLAATWVVVAGIAIAVKGLRDDWLELALTPFGTGGLFLGLGVLGVGGLVAAIALSIPGREAAAKLGVGAALVGLAYAAGVGTVLFVQSPIVEWTGNPRGDLTCLGIALAVGLVPGLGIAAFAGRAAAFRPLVLALAAAAGTAALGAAAAQAMCPSEDLRHLMLGHLFAPGVGALVLTLPLLVALRRGARGAGPTGS